MTLWHGIFWLSAAYILYTYFGYPALLAGLRKLRGTKRPSENADSGYAPIVSIIVTCRNEEKAIGQKIEDLLAQDYPADRMEIWVASDQSTDGTNAIVREIGARDSRVRLVDYTENIGKSVAINRTVPLVGGEIIISSDARQRVVPEAVRLLVRHFADPKVGIVGAEMTLVDAEGRPSTECTGLYWKYERAVRGMESDLDLLAGVSGAFFAVRRSVFRDIPPGSYCEDVTLALYARQQGCDVRWEPGAQIFEVMRDPYTEFRRKVRTLVGNYQLISQFWPMYLPWRGSTAFSLISHKVCRLFIPLGLMALLLASLVLATSHPFYMVALIGQVTFYTTGALAMAMRTVRRQRLVNACGAFCLLNWAALVAMFHVMRHGPRIQWR